MSGKQKIVLALFIFGYVLTSGVAEAKIFNVIQSVFNIVCGSSPSGSHHPKNAPKTVCTVNSQRLRIPKPQEIKRRGGIKKKTPDRQRQKKSVKYLKMMSPSRLISP